MKLLILTLFFVLFSSLSFSQPELEGCIEIPPVYPGGHSAINKLFASNFQSFGKIKKQATNRMVIVHYMVDTSGNTTNINVSKGSTNEMEKEAVRLVGLLKGWIPATLNGKKINFTLSQPFYFR